MLAASKIPVFYGIPNPVQIQAHNAVCATSTVVGSGSAVGFMAKSLGLTSIGLVSAASPTFVASENLVNASATKLNINVTADLSFPLGTTDLSPDFAQAMNGAGGMWLANIGPDLSPSIMQFLQSYPGSPLITQYLAEDTLQQVGPAGDGKVYFPLWTQPLASNVPGAKQFIEDAKNYGDPADDEADQYIPFWLPMKLFAGIAATIKGPVTAASMRTAIKKAKNVSMGGLVPNYSGSELGADGVPCMWQTTIVPAVDQGGRLVSTYSKPNEFLNTTTGKIVKLGS
jgi:hypothetical protein